MSLEVKHSRIVITSITIRSIKTQKDVSLKSVLLLVIFAAVDIAASTGFVMVRIIMVGSQEDSC